MQAEYKISIITVNYNGLKDTCTLIDTIPWQQEIQIIVVDNGSRQDEASILTQLYPHVQAIRSEQNLGFAGGNNLGIKAAKGDYLFLINNDTEFRGEWNIGRLIERMERDPRIAIVCPKIRFAWGSNPIQFAGFTKLSTLTLRNRCIGYGEEDHGQYDTAHVTPYAHGAAMLIRRTALEQVGLMPECYFLYYEELDWSIMFSRHSYLIWYDPACTIYHKESQSTGQNSPLKSYYLTRNRFLFARRNVNKPIRCFTYAYLALIVCTRDVLVNCLKGRFRHVRSTVKGIFDFCKLQSSLSEKPLRSC